MGLAKYHAKRDFKKTAEPRGRKGARSPKTARSFVIQKHAATRLHYDFRLELDGVLKSWAVPKGPSLSPEDKRLAVEVEDHPLEYGGFEGTIPKGEYGGGTVLVWDRGTWEPEGDPAAGLAKGHLVFALHGEKLRGRWALIRMKPRDGEKKTPWLLVKERDEAADDARDVVGELPLSVATRRDLDAVAAGAPPRAAKRAVKKKAATAKKRKVGTAKKKAAPAKKKARVPRSGGADPFPARIAPQLATRVDAAPEGESYVYEIKYDGYRILAKKDGDRVTLLSRTEKDWSAEFPRVAAAVAELDGDLWLDGEVCVMTPDGRTSFQALQNRATDGSDIGYFVFDVLYAHGKDLRELPLLERKEILRRILANEGPRESPLRYADHVDPRKVEADEPGATFFREACELGLEGIVAKRGDRPYRSVRSLDWQKCKCSQRQETVIGGFTQPAGSRVGIGALLVGVRDEKTGTLRYAGKVGTGFDTRTLRGLKTTLEGLRSNSPPFSPAPRIAGATWVVPDLVCEVKFTEWTTDGHMRHPSFLGLRADKPATEVEREVPMHVAERRSKKKTEPAEQAAPTKGRSAAAAEAMRAVANMRLTHPERVVEPASGLTKVELARYFAAVAPWMMPWVGDRPLSLLRCPDGAGAKCFFQKHRAAGMPASIRLRHRGEEEWMYVSSTEGLLALCQFNAMELHVWGSRIENVEAPDQLVLDLDPAPDVSWKRVVEAAGEVRSLLDELGLAAFVKTTGGKGLHVVVPLVARGGKHGWDIAKGVSHGIANELTRRDPAHFTASMSKAHRTGKIFVDYLRNGRGATAVAAYSPRARAQAPVSMPLSWEDLESAQALDFTVRTVPGILAGRKSDPWKKFDASRRALPEEMPA